MSVFSLVAVPLLRSASGKVREVMEETSVRITKEQVDVIGFYESVYPPLLSNGPPQRTHIIPVAVARLLGLVHICHPILATNSNVP